MQPTSEASALTPSRYRLNYFSEKVSMTDIEAIRSLIRGSRRIAVLTGAGISTESGIPDFKSMDHSWDFEEPREAMLSALFWQKDPKRFWEVYRSTLRSTASSESLEPSSFHRWLVELESRSSVNILTQNVDGLHTAAGSKRVIEAHGNSSRAICIECYRTVPMESLDGNDFPICEDCGFPPMKPDISLFFEGVTGVGDFRRTLKKSDLLIVAGTSLKVGPVNELPYYAQSYFHVPSLWISDEEPPDVYSFTYKWIGKLSKFVEEVS